VADTAAHPYAAEADRQSIDHYYLPLSVRHGGYVLSVPVLRYAWWNATRPKVKPAKRDHGRAHIMAAVRHSWYALELPLPAVFDWADVESWLVPERRPQLQRQPSAIYQVSRVGDPTVELCLLDELVLGSADRTSFQAGIIRRFKYKCQAVSDGRGPGYIEFGQLSLEWLRHAA
jgi:hypothetical protein